MPLSTRAAAFSSSSGTCVQAGAIQPNKLEPATSGVTGRGRRVFGEEAGGQRIIEDLESRLQSIEKEER